MVTLKKEFVLLPDGSRMPRLGQGTWHMGEDDQQLEREVRGLRHGVSLGLNMIDTAEMYADGKTENVVGNAIRGLDRRDLYLVSKVYPWNANRHQMYSSLECTLKRMETDCLDMYLLHWREEDTDLAEAVYCLEDLKAKGKIKRWGVSNFDVEDMEDLWAVPDGKNCQVNQVMYNLGARGIEYDLFQWQREKNVPFMAYCPVGQAGALVTEEGVSKAMLMNDQNVLEVARRHNASVVQVLLAWVPRQPDMIAIPKAVGIDHIEENVAASHLILTEEDLALLDASFPAPVSKVVMETR